MDRFLIFKRGQIVGQSNEERCHAIDAIPDVRNRPAFRLHAVQTQREQSRLQGLDARVGQGNERISVAPERVAAFEQASHPSIPHHRLEETLESLAARVMSARHILGVIFLIDEDGTGLEPAMLPAGGQVTRQRFEQRRDALGADRLRQRTARMEPAARRER